MCSRRRRVWNRVPSLRGACEEAHLRRESQSHATAQLTRANEARIIGLTLISVERDVA